MKKYLALGDSYTIGESVEAKDNFPHQFCQLANDNSLDFEAPKIIAKTGWTSDELLAAIALEKPAFDNDLVTLLIGVNNQYRGRDTDEYYWQFYSLLCQSILFAKSIPQHVIVLSIPDWGLTPFNKDRDKTITSSEIDQYNQINKEITLKFGAKYIDVTLSTREHAEDATYLASDLLHYGAKEYQIWAQKMIQNMND